MLIWAPISERESMSKIAQTTPAQQRKKHKDILNPFNRKVFFATKKDKMKLFIKIDFFAKVRGGSWTVIFCFF